MSLYDSDIFCYLREMRALRYDQAQQVVLESAEVRHGHLSPSQISTIINHWMNDGYAVYQHIYGEKMKWIIPTRKGLSYAGFKQCAKTLSEKTLKHLYWVNAVRITLQEKFVAMTWFPERDLRAEEVRRGEKHHWQHIPDAQVTFGDGKGFFDIEVQVSRPSSHAVERMMMENVSGRKKNPLYYYVNKKSERVVREVYDKLVKEECPIRSHIEIIDLETFLQR